MSQILNRVKNVDPNNSDAIKEALSQFFQHLQKHKEYDSYKWLQELENVVNRFPKYCASQRSTIESHLVHFLDSNNYHHVVAAAKCAHVLQQVKPSHEKTATAKSGWRDLMSLLCQAVHQLINTVYPDAVDILHQTESVQEVEARESPLGAALCRGAGGGAATRLRNVLVFMQAMLVEPYPSPKPVRPQSILWAISRAATAPASAQPFAAQHKVEALRCLDAMAVCLGANLVPFSALVSRLVMQTLKWGAEQSGDDASVVRIAAYRSMRCHLRASRQSRAARRLEDELTLQLLTDLAPADHAQVTLTTSLPTKQMSKKAKRRLANAQLRESSLGSHAPGPHNTTRSNKQNDEVLTAALECLETFLDVCGPFLKNTTHKSIMSSLVRRSSPLPTSVALPLVRCVEAARAAAAAGALPSLTHYCLQLYASLLHHSDHEVSTLSSRLLRSLRLQLHAAPPSLSFALETPPETSSNIRTDRNRATLEALLGTNRVPVKTEEVITIGDEPVTKKPRLEQDDNDVDGIIVSSDSQHSVIISDDDEQAEPTNDDVDKVVIVEDIQEVIETENVDDEAKENQDPQNNSANKDTEIKINIYEAATQLPVNSSIDNDEETPSSMEVTYDDANSNNRVTAIERIEEDNLPSTNDTDDIQITCGQVIISQEDPQKKDEAKTTHTPLVNGKTPSHENGISKDASTESVPTKTTDGVSVEDMLADFVDEVK